MRNNNDEKSFSLQNSGKVHKIEAIKHIIETNESPLRIEKNTQNFFINFPDDQSFMMNNQSTNLCNKICLIMIVFTKLLNLFIINATKNLRLMYINHFDLILNIIAKYKIVINL